jgi:hypothetical protein
VWRGYEHLDVVAPGKARVGISSTAEGSAGKATASDGARDCSAACHDRIDPECSMIKRSAVSCVSGANATEKSCAALGCAIAVSTGIGKVSVNSDDLHGHVLYFALVDDLATVRDRLFAIDQCFPARLHIRHSLPAIAAGGLEVIEHWLTEIPGAALVVIDPLGVPLDHGSYFADVRALGGLADRYGVAVLLACQSDKYN